MKAIRINAERFTATTEGVAAPGRALRRLGVMAMLVLASACAAQQPRDVAREPVLPVEPALAVIDVRERVPAEPIARAQLVAAAELQKDRPDIEIDWNRRTGTPRRIYSLTDTLTGPSRRAPEEVVRQFLRRNPALFGLGERGLDSLRTASQVRNAGSPELRELLGALHRIELAQVWEGRPVHGMKLLAVLRGDGRLVSVTGELMPDLAAAVAPDKPVLDVTAALVRAARSIGLDVDPAQLAPIREPAGPEQRQTFARSRYFNAEVSARAVQFPVTRRSVRPAWELFLGAAASVHRYQVIVDAISGEVLLRRSITLFENARWRVYPPPLQSPAPLYPGPSTPDGSQGVVVPAALVEAGAPTPASPNGWLGGPAAAPDGWLAGVTATIGGNNIVTLIDVDADGEYRDTVDPVMVDVGGVTVPEFDYPADFTAAPSTTANKQAAAVNAFFLGNWFHDRLFELGFTEAAGNYQMENFTGDGLAGDPLVIVLQLIENSPFLFPGIDGDLVLLNASAFTGPEPDRDAAFDAQTLIHEMTHALTTRIVGGADLIGLTGTTQARGMNEGYSDWYALALLSPDDARAEDLHALGGWVSYHLFKDFGDPPFTFAFEDNYHYGLRRYPYTTFVGLSPLSFEDIDPAQYGAGGAAQSPFWDAIIAYMEDRGIAVPEADEVHNVGEIWALMLWEVHANLVRAHGAAAGNELALQLVTDSLFFLHQESPTFTEARDALLLADNVRTGGENACRIWRGFAKRGLGVNAYAPPDGSAHGVIAHGKPPFACGSPTAEFASMNAIGLIASANSDAGLSYLVDGSAGTLGAGDTFAFMPIQLPHGATITRLKCVAADNTESGYMQILLKRGPINTNDGTSTPSGIIASVSTCPTCAQPGFQELVGQARAPLSVVDNERYGYLFRVDFLDKPSASALLRLRGCTVEYEP